MRKFLVVWVIFLAICFLGCNSKTKAIEESRKEKESKKVDWTQYYPLEKGNMWVYGVKAGSNTNLNKYFIIVSGKENVNGTECFVCEGGIYKKSEDKRKIAQWEYYTISDEGLFAVKRAYRNKTLFTNFNPPEPMLKFPLEKGKKWEWQGQIFKNTSGKFSFEVIGEEEVITPAGTFKAIRVDMKGTASDGSSVESSKWYVEGVGVVKEESTTAVGHIVAELVWAKVNGKEIGVEPKE